MAANPPSVTLGIYWINDFKQSPTCDEDPLNYRDDLARNFMGAMRARGHRAKVNRSDVAASPRHWKLATDRDANGVDTVDFAFLTTHGNTFGKNRNKETDPKEDWLHWVVAAFNSHDGCLVSTIELDSAWRPVDPKKPTTAMQLGNGSLRWVVLDLCRSLQIGHENETPKYLAEHPTHAKALLPAKPGNTWTRCFAGVHIIFGFTGLSSDASWSATRGPAFGLRAGGGEPLADSWLDEAHSSFDAPVALGWGRDRDDALRRVNTESLSRPEPTLARADIRSAAWVWRS